VIHDQTSTSEKKGLNVLYTSNKFGDFMGVVK